MHTSFAFNRDQNDILIKWKERMVQNAVEWISEQTNERTTIKLRSKAQNLMEVEPII